MRRSPIAGFRGRHKSLRTALKGRAMVCGCKLACAHQIDEACLVLDEVLNEQLRVKDETIKQYQEALRRQQEATQVLRNLLEAERRRSGACVG